MVPRKLKDDLSLRYFKFFLVIVSAGAIYPLLYLRQNFELSIREHFQLTLGEFGDLYSLLGITFFLCYFPSGWLADRFSPKNLVVMSLLATSLTGYCFAYTNDSALLPIIYVSWGLSTGLTFWAPLIKCTYSLAKKEEQGRFFGFLEGGRGLVEAILATMAVAIFTYVGSKSDTNSAQALRMVILFYATLCLFMAILDALVLDNLGSAKSNQQHLDKPQEKLTERIKELLTIRVALVAFIILTAYQLFWVTYSFSAFLQVDSLVGPVTAGGITVGKLWMRPLASISAGFLGDRIKNEFLCAGAQFCCVLALITLAWAAPIFPPPAIAALVIFAGFCCYATRGVYWALLDQCQIKPESIGLAIGAISLLAYSPDIFLPQLLGWLSQDYEGMKLYRIYFSFAAISGLLGCIASLKLAMTQDHKSIKQLFASLTQKKSQDSLEY